MRDALSCILSDEELVWVQRFKSFHTSIDSASIASHVSVPCWWLQEKRRVSMATLHRESE